MEPHTQEGFYAYYFRENRYVESEINRLNWLFRNWRESAIIPIDKNLLWCLSAIANAA